MIVDDSPTAREGLRRRLADHELRGETAESAEAALEFLVLHRPDVIFMDHRMPGMDGFQAVKAVKAIKENPATATIPVMMYTSQSGELYVGQARAPGAVGVLPKQIKPAEVREVLRSLHLLPGDVPPAPARRAGDQGVLPGVESVNAPADWSDLHRWLQEMLVDHNRALRADLEATVSRALGDHLPTAIAGGKSPRPRTPFWPAGTLITTLAVVAAAPDDLQVARCDRIGRLPEEARAESARQTVAFANYLAELAASGGPISAEFEPLGNTRPLVPYPGLATDVTAGEWNRVARQNQRVEARFAAQPAAAAQPQVGGS